MNTKRVRDLKKKANKVPAKKGWRKEGQIPKREPGRIYFVKDTIIFSVPRKSTKKGGRKR